MTDPVATDPNAKSGRGGNLLTHGAYSVSVLLLGENKAEYDKQLQALHDELRPEGPSEEAAVKSVHRWIWAEQRITAELTSVQDRLQVRRQRAEAVIARIEAATTREEVKEALESAPEVRKNLTHIGTTSDMLKAIEDTNLENAKRREIEAVERYAAGTSEAAAAELERLLALLERIQANRNRELKNLMQLKAMKQTLQWARARAEHSPASSPKAIAHHSS